MLLALPCLICMIDPALSIGVIGGAITICSMMIAGLRLERLAQQHVTWLPADVGAAGGLIVGVAIALRWVIPTISP